MADDNTTRFTPHEKALMEIVAAANEVLKAPGWGRDEDSARSELDEAHAALAHVDDDHLREARSWLADAIDKAQAVLPEDRCARCGGVGHGPYNRLCHDERYSLAVTFAGGRMCVCPDCDGKGVALR